MAIPASESAAIVSRRACRLTSRPARRRSPPRTPRAPCPGAATASCGPRPCGCRSRACWSSRCRAAELLGLADGGWASGSSAAATTARRRGRRSARDVAHEVGVRVAAVLRPLVAVEDVRERPHPVLVRRRRRHPARPHRVPAEEGRTCSSSRTGRCARSACTTVGSASRAYAAQNGHWRSANSTSVAGASVSPSAMPSCGIPSYSAWTSSATETPSWVEVAGVSSSAPLLETTIAPATTTAASAVTRASWSSRLMSVAEVTRVTT